MRCKGLRALACRSVSCAIALMHAALMGRCGMSTLGAAAIGTRLGFMRALWRRGGQEGSTTEGARKARGTEILVVSLGCKRL